MFSEKAILIVDCGLILQDLVKIAAQAVVHQQDESIILEPSAYFLEKLILDKFFLQFGERL
jgi:hypothetical protein